jgi:hypothetical protein
MKMLRLLIPIVLLVIALPSYAACGTCEFNCNCFDQHGVGSRCRLDKDCCYEVIAACFSGGPDEIVPALAVQYTIASVDVDTPTDTEIRLARQERKSASAVKTAPAP